MLAVRRVLPLYQPLIGIGRASVERLLTANAASFFVLSTSMRLDLTFDERYIPRPYAFSSPEPLRESKALDM